MIKSHASCLRRNAERRLRLAASILTMLVCTSVACAAGDFATDWAEGLKSKARLIVARSGATWQAGIEVALAPKTVTYWRTPGEAGVPPRVSFDGSENLASATMSFPPPVRLDEDGLEAFGYLGSVTFPLRVTATDPTKPVALRVRFDYAACQRICIPVHAGLSLRLPTGSAAGPFAAQLAEATRLLPQRQALGGSATLRIDAVHPLEGDLGAGKATFQVDAHAAPGGLVALFIEAPEGWYTQTGKATPRPSGGVAFAVAIVQAPPDAAALAAAAKVPITLTLAAGSHAIEVPASLDSKAGSP